MSSHSLFETKGYLWRNLYHLFLLLQSSGSVDVHINLDQSAQSEPRMRLQLADSLLRDTQALVHRLEVRPERCKCRKNDL